MWKESRALTSEKLLADTLNPQTVDAKTLSTKSYSLNLKLQELLNPKP